MPLTQGSRCHRDGLVLEWAHSENEAGYWQPATDYPGAPELPATGYWLPVTMRGYHGGMNERDRFLAADDAELLGQCEVHTYKSSGPGGQHRNKVSSAIRLHHRPTGITALANESRSQHDNKLQALRRLRMNIALQLRCPTDLADFRPTEVLSECLFVARGGPAAGTKRLGIGRKDRRLWQVAAVLLDLLESATGRLAPPAASLGITTGNFTSVIKSDRHLLGAAQQIRKTHGHGPMS